MGRWLSPINWNIRRSKFWTVTRRVAAKLGIAKVERGKGVREKGVGRENGVR
jgi:hypothetical protein